VGFEPTIPASERAKTVHVLDRSATVTGNLRNQEVNIINNLLNTAEHFKMSVSEQRVSVTGE
jgi:hypothetical protein